MTVCGKLQHHEGCFSLLNLSCKQQMRVCGYAMCGSPKHVRGQDKFSVIKGSLRADYRSIENGCSQMSNVTQSSNDPGDGTHV